MITLITRKRWLIALVGYFLLLSGCNTQTNTSSIPNPLLNPSQWSLAKHPDTLSRPVTLNFESGRVNGFNGCNSYSGSYVANADGTLALGKPGTSRMLCSGIAAQTEREYMNKLSKVRMYALVRGQLLLLDAERKPLLTFQHTPN
ncbi:MAG: hypothetical protein RLZZ422_1448 [Pseudomonadota bacterium]|jgi:heat shock protein HslJ